MVRVLVDAENVRRSSWPNVGREQLVDLLRAWAAATGHDVLAVFDGRAPEGAADPGIDVVGSGPESADSRLVREARDRAGAGPVWLVTSDRALRSAAEPHVDRIVGGGSFLRELRSD